MRSIEALSVLLLLMGSACDEGASQSGASSLQRRQAVKNPPGETDSLSASCGEDRDLTDEDSTCEGDTSEEEDSQTETATRRETSSSPNTATMTKTSTASSTSTGTGTGTSTGTAVVTDPNAKVVEFRIKPGTGASPWNTEATPVVVKVGQTLKIVNDDTVPHQLHTGGAPCGHQPGPLKPGDSYACVISKPLELTPGAAPKTYDHLNPKGFFYVKALP